MSYLTVEDWRRLPKGPRELPLSTRLGLWLRHPLFMATEVMLGFTLVSLMAVANTDIAALWRFRGPLERAAGRLTAVESTRMNEGHAGPGAGPPILRYEFEFEHGGARWRGSSYSYRAGLEPGAPCELEFPAGRADQARIVGMGSDIFRPRMLVSLVIPLATLLLFGIAWRRVSSVGRLVVLGQPAVGRALAPQRGRPRPAKHHVALVLDFAGGRTQEVLVETMQPRLYEPERIFRVLVDAQDPTRAAVLEDLHLPLRFDARGRIETLSLRELAPGLALAGAVGASYAAWFLWLAFS